MVRNQDKGQGAPVQLLLESAWDYRFDPQTNVINVHMNSLRQKVDKEFSPPPLQNARGIRFTLQPPTYTRAIVTISFRHSVLLRLVLSYGLLAVLSVGTPASQAFRLMSFANPGAG